MISKGLQYLQQDQPSMDSLPHLKHHHPIQNCLMHFMVLNYLVLSQQPVELHEWNMACEHQAHKLFICTDNIYSLVLSRELNPRIVWTQYKK